MDVSKRRILKQYFHRKVCDFSLLKNLNKPHFLQSLCPNSPVNFGLDRIDDGARKVVLVEENFKSSPLFLCELKNSRPLFGPMVNF